MVHTSRRWISLMMTITLIFTLIPFSRADAADSPIVISDPIGSSTSPAPITTEKVNVSGSFYGVTDLTYTVTQMRKLSTGQLLEIQTRDGIQKAYTSGSNFTFYNVDLFEGINMITVMGKSSTGTSTPAERVYVEYSKLPIILSVKYNNQNLRENNEISTKLFNDELMIKGEVNNAESIVARVNGGSMEYTGSVLSNGTYLIPKIPLQRGRNTLEIEARNNSKVYPVKLNVIYNDGNPYISDGELQDYNDATPPVLEWKTLENTMNLTNNELTVRGSVNNFILNDELNILFNNIDFDISYTLFDNTLVGSVVAEDPGVYTLTRTGTKTFELHFDNVKQNALNVLQFTFSHGSDKFIQTYRIEHFNPSVNYITRVSGLTDSTTNKLLTFYVYTNKAPLSEALQILPSGNQNGLTPVDTVPQADGTTMYKYTTTLEPGYNDFILRPNSDVTHTNEKSYRVLYINSPDVKILNLVNGDRVGGSGQEMMLFGELVNINLGDREKTKLTIKNRSGSASYLLQLSDFNNVLEPYKFTFDLSSKLKTGANDILIEVTDGVTLTTTRLTLFYFSDSGPQIDLIVDTDETLKIDHTYTFTENDQGIQETEARYAHLQGSFNNTEDIIFYLNGIRVITQKVQDTTSPQTYSTGIDPVSGETVRLRFDWANRKFYTDYPISLHEGSNTFEAEVISSSGTSTSAKLYINRFQPPVKLVKPELPREKVINSNYVEVVIEAPDAEKIVIDKEEARYIKLSNEELLALIRKLPIDIQESYNIDGGQVYDPVTGRSVPDLSDTELSAIDQGEITGKRFEAEVFLKSGKNTIKYEVHRNGNKDKYEFEIYYAASPKEGAKYKIDFSKSRINVFDKKVELDFPKNTWLIEPDEETSVIDAYKNDAYLKFGIVDRKEGRLNKIWDGTKYDLEKFADYYEIIMPFKFIPPDRTGYAGDIYWIEADGDIRNVDSGLLPSNRGEITIEYNPSIRNDAQNLLAIYHFDREKENWVNLGGVVDTKKHKVTTSIDEFGYYTVMAKRGTYNDIIQHSWAANYLQAMFSKGLMLPESYNRFGSDILTSRGEFATVLVKALDIPINAGPYSDNNKLYPINPTFVDVVPLLDPENGFYSYEYIETAGRAGIIRGLGQGEFAPDGLLTREQAAIMIARAANYKLTSDMDRAKQALRKIYADADSVNDYAIPYVLAVTKEDVMSGSISNGTTVFNPRAYLSRAESATIAYRLMQQLGNLPK